MSSVPSTGCALQRLLAKYGTSVDMASDPRYACNDRAAIFSAVTDSLACSQMPAVHRNPLVLRSAVQLPYLDFYNGRHPHSRLDGAGARSSLLHHAATPLGSLTSAEAPLIDAETLFRQPGPALLHDGLTGEHGQQYLRRASWLARRQLLSRV